MGLWQKHGACVFFVLVFWEGKGSRNYPFRSLFLPAAKHSGKVLFSVKGVKAMNVQCLSDIMTFSTQELTPCDNYRPVTIFWPCPEVVTISDKHCN